MVFHGSILSRILLSVNPGAVHFPIGELFLIDARVFFYDLRRFFQYVPFKFQLLCLFSQGLDLRDEFFFAARDVRVFLLQT